MTCSRKTTLQDVDRALLAMVDADWPILYRGAEQDAAAQLLIAAGRLTVAKTGPGWYIVEVVA